ncbi:hypothetical protein QBC44DRAFT_296333 [Cladorrhinum sp. PSN332]|nr:hypothetical protein QBC44DRAFT_296333 [Cladorrhinum sp. PSN332]
MVTDTDSNLELRCYCNKTYQNEVSFRRHSRTCRTADEDCRSFLRIIACLDPRPVPGDMFYRCLFPLQFWNEKGNESSHHVFKLEVIFDSLERLQKAIDAAVAATALTITRGAVPEIDGSPWWISRYFYLPLTARSVIRNDLAGQYIAYPPLKRWEFEATKVVINSFPLPDLDPCFLQRGPAFAPFLAPLTSALPTHRLHPSEVPRVIEVCISSTTFGDPSTKEVALKTAHHLASQITPSYLDASVQCCRMRVQLLLTGPGFTITPLFDHSNTGNRANAQKAEYLLLLSQECIERDEVSRAWEFLQKWTPLHAAQPSALESIMSSRIDLMKGKMLRFQGKFTDARQYLEPLVHQYPAPRSQFLSRIHLIAVYCELGLWDKAHAIIESTAAEAITEQQQRILQLTTAEYHLARALSITPNRDDLDTAMELLVYLSQKYMALQPQSQARKRNYFRVCVGLAMVQHMQLRRHPASSFRTLGEWMIASWACRGSISASADGGFPRVICLLSMAEIKCRSPDLPDQVLPDVDISHAREIWSCLTRQNSNQRFIFTNLGTRWATAVCGWLKEFGKPDILAIE